MIRTDVERRRLLVGAATSAAVLAIGAAPSTVRGREPDPIIALWAERNRLREEASRVGDEVAAMPRATKTELAAMHRRDDEASALISQACDVEGDILALDPVSPEGWHIQALILLDSLESTDPVRGDSMERDFAGRLVRHFAGLAGKGGALWNT